MFGELGLAMIVVKDMERSVGFYRDVLGLKLVFKTDDWTHLDAGNIHIGLHAEGEHLKVQPHSSVQLGFYVDDVQKAADELKGKGVKFVMEPHKEDFGWLAIFSDPDGYHIQLGPKYNA